ASNLRAERALSNFDIPYRFNGDFLWQLPFGKNRHWMGGDSVLNSWFGDWQLNGDFNFATSTPFTARVIGAASDIQRGTNGTLRPNATGQGVSIGNRAVGRWFNTAAFVVPAPGTYGNAARNTIFGPPTHSFDMSMSKTFAFSDKSMDLR